ncbi:DUF3352 domain-containing protein [Scytonema hofmannii FACHB-248]|uniref:DUF3352 domain-containing protein n=1 Tax=Scytonema hofmannii FACHB-248 TaxID=1842502 RepID=A0ABR8GY00_9CYAN|nr:MULTISPECIES: DUF3352 domain-containing protein [Nostocales]MBD2608004.1 DUF3352 domain-containing protein [Scytonema hofmannii FACHB-248]
MPETKSKFLIPAIGAAVIVTGSIAAYMYLKGPFGNSSDALASAKIVPSEAFIATYISTDPQAWAKLQQFGTPEAQKIVAKGLDSLNKDLLTESNISYEKDLKPWVGGVMIAVLPSTPANPTPNAPPATREPNILMVVGIKDKLAALNFAKKLQQEKGVTTKEIDYKGEKITETTGKGKPSYSAVLNNTYVVLAPLKETVENSIDTYKGEPSFVSKSGADSVFAKNVDVKNTVAQIYVPDYSGMVQQLVATNSQTTIPPETLKQLKQVKSMVADIGVDDAGVRMKAIANLDPQVSKFQYQNTSAKIVANFPSDTLALINGQGISSWWSAVVEQSKDYPEFKQAVEQARGQLKAVNFDLDKDIFGWMNGEFGFAAIPSNQGILAQLGVGGAFVFDTSDRKTAESTFAKLDNLAKTQKIKVAQTNIGGKDITEWQIPQQGALLAHGWLDQDTIFVALGGPIGQAIAEPKNQSLDNSDNFKAVTSSLQKPNGGFLYLDMDKTVSLVNRYAVQGQAIPPEVAAILSSIRGLGLTATSLDKSTSQVEMLLALKAKTAK